MSLNYSPKFHSVNLTFHEPNTILIFITLKISNLV